MHRIDGPGATPTNRFTDGDPQAGVPATVVTDDWCNAVQEEMVAVVLAAGIALSKPNNTQVLAAIQALIASNAVPAGITTTYAGSVAPAGWLVCDGTVVARASYVRLFNAIGTTYNTGGEAGADFRLPDARGLFLRGMDAGRGLDVGRALGTLQQPQVQAHKHVMPLGEATTGGGYVPPFGMTTSGGRRGMEGNDSDNFWFHTNDGSNFDGTVNAPGVVGSETRPVNLAQVILIKT